MYRGALTVFLWLGLALLARAELTIEITQGADDPTVIAVVPMGWSGQPLPENVMEIVEADLQRSGLFRALPQRDMLSFPRSQEEVFYRDWRILGAEYLLLSRMTQNPAGGFSLDYELFDVLSQKRVFKRSTTAGADGLRDIAHAVSDAVYEAVTGIRGAFSTRIVYVEALGKDDYDAGGCRRCPPEGAAGIQSAHYVAGLVAGRQAGGLCVF